MRSPKSILKFTYLFSLVHILLVPSLSFSVDVKKNPSFKRGFPGKLLSDQKTKDILEKALESNELTIRISNGAYPPYSLRIKDNQYLIFNSETEQKFSVSFVSTIPGFKYVKGTSVPQARKVRAKEGGFNRGIGEGALLLRKVRMKKELYELDGFVIEGSGRHLTVVPVYDVLGSMDRPRFFIEGADTCYQP